MPLKIRASRCVMQVNKENNSMRDFKKDSTLAVSRFGRDKRQRVSSTQRVERSPRPQRDADNGGDFRQKSAPQRERRASYNPNFTADNRPVGEQQPRSGARGSVRGGYRAEGGQKSGFGAKSKFGAGSSPRRGAAGGFKKSYRSEEKRSYPKYAAKQPDEMRLNRFLAQSGLCSRREADDFIQAGLVTVNGEIVSELGVKIRPTDEVKFNGERIQGEKKVYLVLNKPKGYVTSLEDPHADKTVMELVKDACTERIYPVGRLDKNSLGLLLFTNDGDVTRQLTHPSLEKKKIYQVSLDKPLTRADMERITEGITLEDGEIYADEVAYVDESKKEVGIEIHSGRNRIVRRIFEYLGYSVQKLDRVYYAGITKKNLKRGAWRFLTKDEVDRLKSGRYE